MALESWQSDLGLLDSQVGTDVIASVDVSRYCLALAARGTLFEF